MRTETIVYRTAIAEGMPHTLAELIVAQSKHESQNYTSNVFKKNNNLFGYKYVGQKGATKGSPAPSNEGLAGAYARYETIEGSVKELTGWIKRRQKEGSFPADLTEIDSPEKYATLLRKSGYFGAPLSQYIAGLTRYYKDF